MLNLDRSSLEFYSSPQIDVIALALTQKVLVSSNTDESSIIPIEDGSDFGII